MADDAREKANSGRVHITYDVDTNGGPVQKELPFLIGVIGDFAGDRKLPSLSKRRFVGIDRRTLDTVMTGIAPTLALREVENVLSPKPDEAKEPFLHVDLTFRTMEDFTPARIVEQVPQLKELVELRSQLTDLKSKALRSEDLRDLLKRLLNSRPDLEAIHSSLQPESATGETG